ncbi:glycosyltransferase family 2 protein [Candidatus Uhrbacteria bacterium]|nr:glycosyltransferase family 2 protein [Candidatus Uhrbacteria bacterium]
MARIAIVIPIFGSVRPLRACLASIARQTFRDVEIVVVDDGNVPPVELPTCTTAFPMRLLRQAHAGAPVARNLGAGTTDSELLLFCDADVVLDPHALARMEAALREHPEASYAYSAFRFGWKRFSSFPFDPQRLRSMPYIHTTALMRRAHFPGFDPTLSRFQDWDLWLTMLAQGHTGAHIPETLFRITSTRGTMSRWIPSFVYRLPWKSARVRAYEDARDCIMQKHHLSPERNVSNE